MAKKQTTIGETLETEGTVAEVVEEVQAEIVEETSVVVAESMVPAVDQSDEDFLVAEESANAGDDYGMDRIAIFQKDADPDTNQVAGEFYCKSLDLSWPSFPAVLLRFEKSRILWPEKYKVDNDPLCKSHDAVTPVTDDDSFTPKAKNCGSCPFGKWGGTKNNRIPPECNEVMDMVILNLDELVPYMFSVHSTGLGATNKTLMKILNGRKRYLSVQRPAHECMFAFDVGTELKKNDSGNAYIPTYNNIRQLDLGEIDIMVHAAKQVRDVDIHFSAQDEEESAGDGGDAGNGEIPSGADPDKF